MKSIIVYGTAIVGYADSEEIQFGATPNEGIRVGNSQIAISTDDLSIVQLEEEIVGEYWEYEYVDGQITYK